MSRLRDLEKACRQAGGDFRKQKQFQSDKVSRGVCRLGASTLTAWPDSDRLDVEEDGFDFIFEADEIKAWPTGEIHVHGGEGSIHPPREGISKSVTAGVDGITSAEVRQVRPGGSYPLFTVHKL